MRPQFLFAGRCAQVLRTPTGTASRHDPNAPELRPDDLGLDLDTMMDRVPPPGAFRGGLDAIIKQLNEASRDQHTEAMGRLDEVMEGIPGSEVPG